MLDFKTVVIYYHFYWKINSLNICFCKKKKKNVHKNINANNLINKDIVYI